MIVSIATIDALPETELAALAVARIRVHMASGASLSEAAGKVRSGLMIRWLNVLSPDEVEYRVEPDGPLHRVKLEGGEVRQVA